MRSPAEQRPVDFASLNSTLTTFLGGKQKPWMTLEQQNPPISATNSPTKRRDLQTTRAAPPGSGTPSAAVTGHRVSNESTHQQSPQWNWRRPSLEQGPSNSTSPVLANTINQRKDSAGQPVSSTDGFADTVLPSPAPSDDVHPDVSSNAVDLEVEQEDPEARRLIDLAARCGGINELERRLFSADRSESLPLDQPTATNPSNAAVVPESEVFGAVQQEALRKRSLGLPRSQKKRARIQMPNGQPLRLAESNEGDVSRQGNSPSATSDPQMPPNPSLKQYLPILDSYVTRFCCNPSSKESIELPRIRLLKDACNTEDCFYLVLHQLYCLYSVEPQTVMQLPGFTQEHIQAFNVLAQLLLRNNMLPDYATKWFSTFPAPSQHLLLFSTLYQTAYDTARNFLWKLLRFWHTIQARCKQRMYPPLVDELVYELHLESGVFQRVAFTAVLRGLWGPDLGDWYLRAEEIFRQDQINSVRRRCRINTANPPTAAEMQAANEKLARDYQTLRIQHLREIRDRSSNPDTTRIPINERPIARVPTQRTSLPSPHEPGFVLPIAASDTSQVRPVARRTQSVASVPASNPHVPQDDLVLVNNGPQPTQPPYSLMPSYGVTAPVPFTSINNPRARTSQTQHTQARPVRTHRQQYAQLDLNRPSPFSAIEHNILSSGPSGPRSWCDSFQPSLETLPPGPSGLQGAVHHKAPAIPGHGSPSTTHSVSHIAPLGEPFLISPASLVIPPVNMASRFNPKPTSSALHQAHIRSPKLKAVGGHGPADSSTELYQYVAKLALTPQTITAESKNFVWYFQVPEVDFQKIPSETPGYHGAPPTREVHHSGSQMYRIRCANPHSSNAHTNESDWAILESVWPRYLFIEINGVHLDLRRKQHHGKDLPIDITPHVKEGVNEVLVSLIGPSKQDDGAQYALAVEIIHVVDHKRALDLAVPVPAHEITNPIKASLTTKPGNDDDLTVVNNTITIDLIDPFSARIFDMPVRGLACRHRECFDHEIYLQTRNSKWPSMVDEWRCPMCGADARPQNLILDCFLVEVREELTRQKRYDTKTIVIEEDGTWRPKAETRNDRHGGEKHPDSIQASAAAAAPGGGVLLTTRKESVVIELDDD